MRPRKVLNVGIIKALLTVTLFHQINGFPDGSCSPKDCTLQDWTHWGECSQSCGEDGVQTRTRLVLQEASCGGSCDYQLTETLPCNRQCCPMNCIMGSWYAWSCECSTSCSEPGKRKTCNRRRYKYVDAKCGGYCDDRLTEKTCNQLCCYQECKFGMWMKWGGCEAQCEQMGTQTRNRIILQNAECGGDPCDEVPTEERECEGACCPVNCVQGDWSHWSECPATCGHANQTRSRYVEQPICGGTPCEEPVSQDYKLCEKYINADCKVSPWSQWTGCQLANGRCGAGSQERIRSILVDVLCQGVPCPDLIERKNCSGPCCVQDCLVTEWTQWSFCSVDCGKGVSQRTRNISTPADCNGSACPTLLESRECEEKTQKNCEFSEWTAWSDCNTDCGTGVQLRSRIMLTPATCGGQCADAQTEDTKPCTSYAARSECKVSDWSDWSPCVNNCEEGVRTRNRTILQQGGCGGLSCSTYELVVSAWSEWGECQRNCEKGIRLRYRNVTAHRVCGGLHCPTLARNMTCHEKCSQLCNQAVCSCKPGYQLQPDGYSCKRIMCSWPRIKNCPEGLKSRELCTTVKMDCPNSQNYNATCHPSGCKKEGYVVKGGPDHIRCLKNQTWSASTLYCGLANKAPLGLELNATEINENWPVGTCFSALTTQVDGEPLDTHTYSIVTDSAGILQVEKNRLCLMRQASYENEAYRKFTATIRTTDFDGLFFDKEFLFTVLNANDPPRSARLVPNRIRENSREGTEVGCLDIQDDDPGQNVSVYLISSAHDTFELVEKGAKTCISLAATSDERCYTLGGTFCTLDYEKRNHVYITVLAEDDGKPPMMTVFDLNIQIIDVNERPYKLTLDPEDVLEEVEPGNSLATIQVEDDERQIHTFRILSNPSNLFSIQGYELVAAKKLDHETNKNKKYRLEISVTDNGNPPLESTLELVFGVGDVNESPYDLHVTPDNSKFIYETDQPRVKENLKGEVIGTLGVFDPDEDEEIAMKVISTYSKFTLESKRCVKLQNVNNYCTAHIVMEESVDFEKIHDFHITVMATDRYKVRVSEQLTVTVIDANDAPRNILINNQDIDVIKVPEDQKSFTLATIRAIDDDRGDNHEFFLSGEAASNFRIEGDQLMTSPTADLDFETHSTLGLIITATDSGTPQQSFEKAFTISIIDRNEAPSDIRLSGNKIAEGSPVGTVIGTLTAQDPDNYQSEHQTFIFSLPDDGRGRFEVKGDKLVVAQPSMRCGRVLCRLDFETESQVKIEVMATDNGRPRMSVTRPFAISVLDENDAPENLRLTRSSVRENMPAETVVGTLNADDYDSGQTLTFEVVDSPDFSVSDDHHLVTNNPLDYEDMFKYSVMVKVTDNGNPPKSSEAVMTVTVQDVNEPPEQTSDTLVEVPEDTEVGTIIANLTFIDPDAHAKIKVALNTFQDVFTATQPTCKDQEKSPGTICRVSILSLANFDFDKKKIYPISLVARDNQDEEIPLVLTIKILNENDPPHDILLDGISTYKVDIDENVSQVDVATLSALDRDKDQTHTYTIQDQQGLHFAISGNILRLSKAADHEKSPELYLTLRVTDSGANPSSLDKNITVIVRDVNEQPSQLALSSNTVTENSDAGTVVGSFIAEDPDNADSDNQLFTFNLIDSADGRFIVQGDQLMVAESNSDCLSKGGDFCHLDYERKSSHSILVSVSDDGLPVRTNRFNLEVTVTDDNDVPRDLRLSKNEVEELAPADTPVGTLSVDDQDVSQTHNFSLLDDAGGMFKIIPPNTLVKATGDRLDNKKTYTIEVEATDSGKRPKSTKETFYLTVTGTDEAPRDISITSQDGAHPFSKNDPAIPEDAAIGSIVGTVSAEDNDPKSDMTFELLDNAEGHFMIESDAVVCKKQGGGTKCSTYMKVLKALDYETMPQYTLVVRAVDGQGMQTSESFTVQVTDVNEPPTDMTYIGGDIRVSENHQGELLSVFTATDPDRSDSHSFSLTDDAEGRFSISQDGQLKTTEDADLDYERVDEMEIRVLVKDQGGLTLEQDFHVKILNLNEKPQSLNISNNEVSEMSGTNTVVGELQVVDPDNEDPDEQPQEFSFTLLDDAGGRFILDGNSLLVANGGERCENKGGTFCKLDYETDTSHNVAIEVKDNGQPALSNIFSLSVLVTDINDPPTELTLDQMSITEGLEVGGVIGTLSASDQDEGQDLQFSISGGDRDTFSVKGNKLLVACTVDFEEKSSYTVTVKVVDNGSPPAETEKAFEVTVVNSNESPTAISIEAVRAGSALDFPIDEPIVRENLVEGTIIGQVIVLDPDKEEKITAIASSSLVSIEEMGCITLTKGTRCVGNIRSEAVLNYEDISSFETNITATDTGGERLVKSFTFAVNNENDDPSDILVEGSSEAKLSVTENSIDSVVAVLNVVDADEGQTHTFAVVDGPQFFYFVGNKLMLTTLADLDYERASEFQVTLSVTDDGKPPSALEKHFTVVVTDLNESPTGVALSKNQIPENSPVETAVGTLTTDDPDNERRMTQSFIYTLTEDDGGRFSIKGDTLTIAKSEFDYEKKSTSVVKVKATDTGSPPMWIETEFLIQILDANEPPTNLAFSAKSIAEDAEVETVVGSLTADDEDDGQILSYNILDTDLLTIRDDQVLVNGQLDFEKSPFINFTVVVSDDGDPSLHTSKVFSIEVNDVNDGPHRLDLLPDQEGDEIEISESMKPGETIGHLLVEDEDSPERITFQLVAPLDGPFILDPAGPSCGTSAEDGSVMTVCEIELQLARKVDFEKLTSDSGTISVEVTTSDKGGLTISNRWDLPVRDTNDPPTDIRIEGNMLKIPENVEGYQIGSLVSVDEDRKDSHIYQVLDYWDVFKVTRDHMLNVTAPLDYESQSEYEVRIKSVDNGSPSLDFTKTFIFTVTDVNEPPSKITLSHDEVSMVAEVNTVVGFVEVADPDNEDDGEDQTFTCVADASQDLFVVENTDNSLKVKSALPPKKGDIALSITCTDSGKPPQTLTSEVNVKVTETADVPKSIELTGRLEVEENTENIELGDLVVVNALNQDPIAGDYTFSATTDHSEASFSVSGHKLVLQTALDFEQEEEVHVHVTVTGADEQGQEVDAQETFLISVLNVNEAPTHIGIYSDTVPENSPAGTVIGDLNTVDPDKDQTYTYRIIGVAAGIDTSTVDPELSTLFELQGRSLVVGADIAKLDYEDTPIYSLLVTSQDPGGLEYRGTVRVRVLDRNDAPTEILLDNTQVAEESPVDTLVGSFSVEDEDEGQTHRCQVENIQDVPFKVEENLKLVVSRDELDHEGTRNYVLKVVCQDEADDGSVLKISSSFVVEVTNVNDPPQNISVSKLVVMENLPLGTIATQITAVDPDNDEITFELIDPDGNFELQGDSTLVTKTTFNYEETTSVGFTIKVTDAGGLSASKEFVLDVGDENEAPSKISLSRARVEENTGPGEMVGTLRTDDEDHGQSYIYTLAPEELAIGHFNIEDDSLVTGDVPLDFEDTAMYRLSVVSTDDGEPPLGKTTVFNITIIDVNEAPTEIIVQPIPPIAEDADVGLVLSEIHVDDEEANQSYSCQVTNTDTPFVMQTSSEGAMTLVLNDHLDYETAKVMDISLSCRDGPFEITKDLTISVTDVNEAPTEIQLDGPMLLPATGKPGYLIGVLSAVDPDEGQTHTFTVRGANSDIVQVKEKNKLVLIKPLPMDSLIDQASPELVLTVQVVDNGGISQVLEQNLKFPITDIDLDALKLPEITIDNKRVDEDAEEGTVIGALYNLNTAVGDNVVFEIMKDVNHLFDISNNTHLVLVSPLVGITSPSVKVTVQARNTQSQQTASRTITIFIKKSMKCKRDGVDCDFDAKCIQVNATYEYCQCNPGFVGDGYSCKDFDDCFNATLPCENGATCQDAFNDYTCICAEGFSGQQCEIKDSEKTSCTSNECQNNAVCEVDKTDPDLYSCICEPGWTGSLCNSSVDDCETALCLGDSQCTDVHLTYLCVCEEGRLGVRCEFLKSSCSASTCGKQEMCVPHYDKEGHECLEEVDVLILHIKYKTGRSAEVKGRLRDFIVKYGRFPVRAAGSLTGISRRSADTTSNVHPYLAYVKESESGLYEVKLVVQDSLDVPYTKSVVINSLKMTCDSIGSIDQEELLLCPAVKAVIREQDKHAGSNGDKNTGNGSGGGGAAAGAGGGVVVIIILVVVGIIVFRKLKRKKVSDSQTNLQQERGEDDSSPDPSHPPTTRP